VARPGSARVAVDIGGTFTDVVVFDEASGSITLATALSTLRELAQGVVQAIHARHPLVPVILMTAHGSEDIAIRALNSGAASYVPKKSLDRDLASTLDRVLVAAQLERRSERLLGSLIRAELHFTLENDPALVPPWSPICSSTCCAWGCVTMQGRPAWAWLWRNPC